MTKSSSNPHALKSRTL